MQETQLQYLFERAQDGENKAALKVKQARLF